MAEPENGSSPLAGVLAGVGDRGMAGRTDNGPSRA